MIEAGPSKQVPCGMPAMLNPFPDEKLRSTLFDPPFSTPGIDGDESRSISLNNFDIKHSMTSNDWLDDSGRRKKQGKINAGKGWAFYLAFLCIRGRDFLSALDSSTVLTSLPSIVANLPVDLEHARRHHHHLNDTVMTSSESTHKDSMWHFFRKMIKHKQVAISSGLESLIDWQEQR